MLPDMRRRWLYLALSSYRRYKEYLAAGNGRKAQENKETYLKCKKYAQAHAKA